ncbi:MAG TPA: tetratricopeptide repeat protein [candidate division Zixibacteria bacterium]|nr:tetratricopeptide repeat protein [candidate division Zixibacteria bacterium]
MRIYKLSIAIILVGWLFPLSSEISAQNKSNIPVNQYQAYLYAVDAHLLELSGNLGSAIASYQKALELNPNFDEARLSLAEIYLRLAKINEALEQGLYIVNKDKKVYRLIGFCYETLKMPDLALQAYQAALDFDSTDVEIWWRTALIYRLNNQKNKAEEYFKKVAELAPLNSSFHYSIGESFLQMENYQEALSFFKKAVELDSSNFQAQVGLATVYEILKEPERALEIYRKLIPLDAENLRLREKIISLNYMMSRYPQAIHAAEEAVQMFPKEINLKKSLGTLYYLQKESAKAESTFTELQKLAPEDPMIPLFLGKIALQNKKYQKAKAHFIQTITYSDTLLDAWVSLARCYAEQDSLFKATETYQKALEKVYDTTEVYFFMGITYSRANQIDKAVEILNRALQHKPQDTRILMALSSTYDRAGNFQQAVTTLEEVLKLDSSNVEALNNLGYILADNNHRLDEAYRLIKKAVEKDPDNGAYLDSYGWVLFKMGKVKEAEEKIKKALDI